ncbi:hypothetical protein F4779DRAFT_615922 [Xylariaceae sp. FL0662B]|nr:hypothetical protein F4779DRAFT_615922 [Xylariaceae sp. FL0662B]
MGVTELAFLTVAAPGPVTPEGIEATRQALTVQDEWWAHNYPVMPRGFKDRGVRLFKQVEDPSVTLLTTHWESVDQHMIWRASPENKTIFPPLKDHFLLEKTKVIHLENVELFKAHETAGGIGLGESPVISITRLAIPVEKREAFDRAWNEVAKGILEEFAKPHIVRSGWCHEKENQASEAFFLVCGWPSVEKHGEFVTAKDFPRSTSAITPFITARDIEHYARVM